MFHGWPIIKTLHEERVNPSFKSTDNSPKWPELGRMLKSVGERLVPSKQETTSQCNED